MQQTFRRDKKLLPGVLLSFPCLPSHSSSHRVYCCGQGPAPLTQHHENVFGHGELPRSPSQTHEGPVFSECSHEDICGNSSIVQKNDGHSKPDIEQASPNPGYGKLNLLDLNHAQQEKMGNQYPCHGEVGVHDLSYGQYKQNTFVPSQDLHYMARRILNGLDRLGDQVDASTYSSLLQMFSNSKSVSNGKFVHDHIISHGLELDGHIEALILEMYCKCDAMEDALFLFSKMQRRCFVPSWNIVMRTLNEQGDSERALQLYERMHLEGILPDKVTYISLMSVCAALAKLCKGVIIHASNVSCKFDSDIVLETAIMNMYAKCGRLADARRLFDGMTDRNVITWTTYITAHTQQNEQKATLQIFHQMHQEGQVPNRVTFVNTISACAGLKDLASGKRIHVLLLCNEVDRDVVIMTALANMYGNCASVKDVLEVLHESLDWNLVTWNALIASLVNCGQHKEASIQFLEMQQHGILPDRVTFLSVVNACSSLAAERQGDQIHACIMGLKIRSDIMLNNALISLCARVGKLCMARKVFEEMSYKNVVSWNTIITAYAQRKQTKDACQLFRQMQNEGVLADKVSLYGYFDVCGTQSDLAEGCRVLACLLYSEIIFMDAFLVTAIITMYGKCGSLKHAKDIFDEFSEHNIITWNALLSAYGQHDVTRALLLFDQLLWEGMGPSEATFIGLLNAYKNPAFLADGERLHTIILHTGYATDVIVANALMNMYSKCGNLIYTQIVFDKMPKRDAISWTTIIGAHGEHGQGSQALELFKEMLTYTVPDEVTFLNVLTACNRSGLLEDGNHWFKSMSGEYGIRPNEDHYSCMIDLLGRAGRLGEAEKLIEQMPLEPSYRAWVAFLGACRYTDDLKRAEFAAQYLFENHPNNHEWFVLLANIYAAAGRKDDAARVRSMISLTDPIKPIQSGFSFHRTNNDYMDLSSNHDYLDLLM